MRSNRLGGGRLLGLSVVALALLAVTALASRAPLSAYRKLGGASTSGLRIDASPWEFALIGGGGFIAFIWVLLSGGWSRRSPIQGSLSRLLHQLAMMLVLLIAALLIAGGLEGLHHRARPPRRHLAAAAPRRGVPPRSSSITVDGWVTWGIVGTLAAMTLLLVVGGTARPRPSEQRLPSAVESAVTAALVDLDTIADPRLAIIAAYRRMEESLAAAGLPRAAPEAPREYLGRVGSALKIDPAPLSTLTTLFEAAKFSLRQLDATARERAITALRALQMQLA